MEELKTRITTCREGLQTLDIKPLRQNIGILLYALNTLDEMQQFLESLGKEKAEGKVSENGKD